MPIFPNWPDLFAIETPLIELVARAVLLYLGILVFMRILPRRTGGEVAHMDLIFILLVAEAAAQSFGDYKSVTEGLIVILTMMGLTHGLNMLSFRVPFFERLTTQPPLEVVRDGKQLSRSMDKELLTEDELMSFLRQSGLDDLRKVKLAVIEGNGKISIIPVSK